MKRIIAHLIAAGLAAVGVGAAAVAQPATTPPYSPPDYAPAAAWLCRDDSEALCSIGLDAIAVAGDGTRTPIPFAAAATPKIDCFYVYPTVSAEPTPFSDMIPGDAEKRSVVAQAARLGSRCRVFAPVYRQLTSAGLRAAMTGGGSLDFDSPYRDVKAAWQWYLAHANHGRGIVLIGHSQGTILLQRLIAEEIDGQPVQRQIVSAFLAGDPALTVPLKAEVGGTFKHVPLCAAAGQTGCAYVWSSYLASDMQPNRIFANHPGGGVVAACVSPAAPGGGTGPLKAYLPRPSLAPANDPPWIEVVGQLTGTCTSDDKGNVLRIAVLPGKYADLLGLALSNSPSPGWGLHRLDVALVLGNILDVLDAEIAGWKG